MLAGGSGPVSDTKKGDSKGPQSFIQRAGDLPQVVTLTYEVRDVAQRVRRAPIAVLDDSSPLPGTYSVKRLNRRLALVPPKPNELVSAYCTSAGRAVLGM